ncbi:MAG TPA: DUF4350 domain-containing protein [Solirubrobacteraceae bacterium]|jgi:hypothetical protein|nr:DUF4350 domain-containing protein [Solirubrobacteraceae bacterium]
MSPAVGWTALGLAVVLAFALVGVILAAVAPAPSGPALSSYATTAPGLAAWAELLERDGHVVRQIQRPLAAVRLPADGTLIALGGRALSMPDARAITDFVQRGGWLVVNGPLGGGGSGTGGADVRGRVIALPDPTFLENDRLARGANAFRALAVAGPPSRPVYFDELIHGYGSATGLGALPERWWFAFALLALALAAFSLSRALRLGGSDPVAPAPASPRTAYVDAMAESLVRTTGRDELVRRVEQAASVESRFRGSL